MKYHLHKYGLSPVKAFKTFSSRRALCNYMRKMDISPSEIADGYFLLVMGSGCSALYDFVACGSDLSHLQAVLNRKTVW